MYFSNTPSNCAATAARIRLRVLIGKNGFHVSGLTWTRATNRSVSSSWNSRLFLMPARVSAGDLLLVALKMPPSRTGTYSNFTAVRCSIAGIASWLRKALGLPKSNMNCGDVLVKAASRRLLDHCGKAGGGRPPHYDDHNTVARASRRSNQPLHGASAPDQHVIAHLQNEHGGE